jgi:large subunit ribosomal protein L25
MKPVIPKDMKTVTDLPLRLRNFLARYPPEIHSAAIRRPDYSKLSEELSGENTSSEVPSPYTPDRDAKGSAGLEKNAWTPSKALLITSKKNPNPFMPNFRFGKWEAPRYGLRQQADLMKLAIKYGAEGLLPPSRKSTEYKETRRAERGLAIKGTGVGQKVKGHKWERTMESRLEDRRKAMEGMPELVRLWKQVRIDLDFHTSIGIMLISLNREVTDVAGSNGPSGKLQHSPPQPMFFSLSFFGRFVQTGFLNAYRSLPASHQHRDLYEP